MDWRGVATPGSAFGAGDHWTTWILIVPSRIGQKMSWVNHLDQLEEVLVQAAKLQ